MILHFTCVCLAQSSAIVKLHHAGCASVAFLIFMPLCFEDLLPDDSDNEPATVSFEHKYKHLLESDGEDCDFRICKRQKIVGQDGAELRCCGRRCLYGDRRTGAQCSRVCLKPPGHAGYHDCLRPQGPGHDAATDNEALALTADAPQPSPPLMQLRAKPCPIVPRRPTPPPGPPPPRMVIQSALDSLKPPPPSTTHGHPAALLAHGRS